MNLKQYTAEIENAASLARRLGVPSSLISQWQTGVRRVPAERCPDIERATDGAVRCEDLRPEVDWAYLRSPTIASDSPPNIEKAA